MDIRKFFEKYIQNQHLPDEHEQFVAWFGSISESEAERIMDEFFGLAKSPRGQDEAAGYERLCERIEARLDRQYFEKSIIKFNSIILRL